VAHGAGVELDGTSTSAAHTLRVVIGGLVALDDRKREPAAQLANGALEQRRFAGAGGADQVERQQLATLEIAAVFGRTERIFAQNILLELDQSSSLVVLMRVVVLMSVVVLMRVAVVVPVVMMMVVIVVVMLVVMTVPMAMAVLVLMGLFTAAAAADGAH
jgi:hypothetical protein